jgi:anaerobic magnesium-protoporphyrin IX monomethyl ester cyclase
MFKRVLLIQPPSFSKGLDSVINAPPLGLEYLAAAIEDLTEVVILDAKTNKLNSKDILKEFNSFNPDIVGISASMAATTLSAIKTAQMIKDANPKIPVVFGGHHATFAATSLLQTDAIDIIVRGEGEVTFRKLIKNEKPQKIRGVSFKKDGKIIHNPDRPLIQDLDKLPFPSRHLLDQSKYHAFGIPGDAIESSRGCPFKCTFCTIPQFYGKIWRARSPERVVREVEYIVENFKKENIFFVDDNFCLDMRRVAKICDLIIRRKLKTNFFSQARVDSIARNPKIVRKMKSAGFWMVFLGIESPHQQNLNTIEKGIQKKQIEIAIKLLKKNEIGIWGAFILGFPDETKEMMLETIEYAKRLDVDVAQFTFLTPLVGSELFDWCKKRKILLSEKSEYFDLTKPLIRSDLSEREMIKIFKSAYRKYYIRPTYVTKRLISRNKLIRKGIIRCWHQLLKMAILGEV